MIALLLIGLGLMLVAFAVVWAISVRVRNYSFVDVAWSYGLAVLAPLYAWQGPGDATRQWLLAAVGVAWSLRLGTYILIRVLRHHPKEDVRYRTLRERWSGPGKFLVFFELQAVTVILFSLPFLFVAFDPAPGLAPLTLAGLVVAAVAVLGEAVADIQMQRFKADPANAGKVCRAGLWNYSRHPNYFFELLVQCGFALAALASPHGWISLLGPLAMAWFLFKVTGIPLTEQHALESKGEAYREYQRTTSAFIPWLPKKA